MTDSGPRRDRADDPAGLVLPNQRRSVALVRRYAADACADLGWAGSADTVGLLVSEAATGAVLRSGGDRLRVRVLDCGLRLRVEVSTAGAAATAAGRPGRRRRWESFVVENLAVEWGTDGMTDWFEVGVCPATGGRAAGVGAGGRG